MTCIVGLVDDNKIYMGADSAGVDGYSLTVRKDEKVFINGDFIMGFTSSFRMGQRFRYSFTPPTHNKEIEIYRYMVSEFAESIRKLFKDHGYATIENSSESGGTFLVGYSGRLFQIGDDFQVGESILNFDSVGCGFGFAKGSLYSTEGQLPTNRIRKALEAAVEFSAGVRPPFHILSGADKYKETKS